MDVITVEQESQVGGFDQKIEVIVKMQKSRGREVM